MEINDYLHIEDAIQTCYSGNKAKHLVNEFNKLVKGEEKTISLDELKEIVCFVIDALEEQLEKNKE